MSRVKRPFTGALGLYHAPLHGFGRRDGASGSGRIEQKLAALTSTGRNVLRKVLALLVAGLFLVFLAQEFGLVRLPYTAGQAVEATQRAFGRRRQAERVEDIPVLTARITRRDAPVTIDAVGSVQPLASVVVRAQVEGRLNEIRFRDGQDVIKGDILALIDATPIRRPSIRRRRRRRRIPHSSPMRGWISNARKSSRRRASARVSNSTRRAPASRSSKRCCRSMMRSSKTRASRSTTRRSARQSAGAPACALSMPAILFAASISAW